MAIASQGTNERHSDHSRYSAVSARLVLWIGIWPMGKEKNMDVCMRNLDSKPHRTDILMSFVDYYFVRFQ
jgi:hypothetical protein